MDSFCSRSVPAACDPDRGVPPVRADVGVHDLHRQQPRVFRLKADNLGQLLSDRFRDPQCAPFIHKLDQRREARGPGKSSATGPRCLMPTTPPCTPPAAAEQRRRFVFHRPQHLFGVGVVGRDRDRRQQPRAARDPDNRSRPPTR